MTDPMVRAYADKDTNQSVASIMSAYKRRNSRADTERSVELQYSVENLSSAKRIKTVRFILSENEDYPIRASCMPTAPGMGRCPSII